MKFLLFVLPAALSFCVAAQQTPTEIKKFRIASATETRSFTEGGVQQKMVYNTYYDRNGNDTAYYSDGVHIYNKKFVTDEKKRNISMITYDNYGSESERTDYTYEANGNYSTTSRHKLLNAVQIKWFDKSGRLLKHQRHDGSTLFYDYNAKGQLIQVMTMLSPSGKGDILHLKYTYNSKGEQIKEENIGTHRWVKTMFYDAKGLMIKSVTVEKDDHHTITTTATYQYTFWK